jgi:L-asparaginase II
MVAFARMMGLPYSLEDKPYIDRDHPIQKQIVDNFAFMCGLEPSQVEVGVDGCSAPNFAVPLVNAAYGLARLCDPSDLPEAKARVCRTITEAMTSNPDMVGGPNSFDTHLMLAMQGKVVVKGGAEGYQAMGIMPEAMGPGSPALGVALKISDGDLGSHTNSTSGYQGHVRSAVALEVLRQLGVIEADQLAVLRSFGPGFPLENFRKIQVGQGYPCFTLRREA